MNEDIEFLKDCFSHLAHDSEWTLAVGEPAIGREGLSMWLAVLNGGEAPTDEDLDDGIEKLDEYRQKTGGDTCQDILCFEEFILVTFDFYLAFGPARMRAVFTDFLLT